MITTHIVELQLNLDKDNLSFQIFEDCSCVSTRYESSEEFNLPSSIDEPEMTTLNNAFTTLKVIRIKSEKVTKNNLFSELCYGGHCERWIMPNQLSKRILYVPSSHVLHQIFWSDRKSFELFSFREKKNHTAT